MDNYLRVVRESGNGPVDFRDGDRYTILTLPKVKASTLRFNAEEIWGRDGYTVDTDDAFDGGEDVLEIVCHGKVARKRLLREFSTVNKELKLYFGSSNYFRLGRVVNHEAELVNARDSVHTINLIFQPFYYTESPDLSGLGDFRIEGDAGAYISFETSMTGELAFTAGENTQSYYATSNGLRVDGLKKSITDLYGKPVARTALKVGGYRGGGENLTSNARAGGNNLYIGYKGDTLRFPEVKSEGVFRIGFARGSGAFKIINKFTMVADFYEDLWYDYERKGRW